MSAEQQGAVVPPGWTCKRLVDCTVDGNITYGIVQPGQHVVDGVPIVRVNNFNNGQLRVDEVMRVSQEIEDKYSRTRLEGGEVLLTLVGSTGQSVVVPNALKGWNVARAIAVVRPQPNIGANWIDICLQTKEVHQFLNERANTTVQKTLNLADVREIPILIPPSGIKARVESVALAISEKIAMNRRIIKTLEQMAQALFKSWFVSFDPVRARMVGRQPEGMDAATSALFPSMLVEVEPSIGMMPQGWEAISLYDTAAYVNGAAFKANDFSTDGSGLPIIKIAELKQGVTAQTKFTEKDFQPKYSIDSGDVCYSWSGSPETSLDVFRWLGGPGWLNQHIFKLVCSSQKQKVFAYYLLKHMRPILVQTAMDKQTTGLGHVTVADMKRIKVVYPDSAALEMFYEKVKPLYEQCELLEKQCSALEQLRNSLLPKLLSGEVVAVGG